MKHTNLGMRCTKSHGGQEPKPMKTQLIYQENLWLRRPIIFLLYSAATKGRMQSHPQKDCSCVIGKRLICTSIAFFVNMTYLKVHALSKVNAISPTVS